MQWLDWLKYRPRGMSVEEWREEFERDHAPKYRAEIAEHKRQLKAEVNGFWRNLGRAFGLTK